MSASNNRPPKRRGLKAATKTTAQKTGEGNANDWFENPAFEVLGLLSIVILVQILICGFAGEPRVAQIGDMLDYTTNSVSTYAQTTTEPAQEISGPWASPGHSCTLDVPTMMENGGTLTVVALRPDGVILSWVGGATAHGIANCRVNDRKSMSNTDYLVSDESYQHLLRAIAPIR